VLELLTARVGGIILRRLKAALLVRNRVTHGDELFAEIVLWLVPEPLSGSNHSYKYRLALVSDGQCVLRYDNEAGKGEHRHVHSAETRYRFSTLDKLFADFERDIRRFKDEDSDS
jgi:Family of unknown function (DUF6516)